MAARLQTDPVRQSDHRPAAPRPAADALCQLPQPDLAGKQKLPRPQRPGHRHARFAQVLVSASG